MYLNKLLYFLPIFRFFGVIIIIIIDLIIFIF